MKGSNPPMYQRKNTLSKITFIYGHRRNPRKYPDMIFVSMVPRLFPSCVMTLSSSGALEKCFVCFRFGAGVRDVPPPLGAPPPLITPKPLPRDPHPSPPAPSSFWNPVSLLRSPSDRPPPHIHPYSGHSRPKPPEEEVRRVSGPSQQRPASSQSDSRPPQGPALDRTDPMMVYDQTLQQHRRLVSKLDLEEKKRREAREKGTEWKIRLLDKTSAS